METIYSRQQIIGTSLCDFSSRLGWTGCFSLFQDLAGEHAADMGCGVPLLMKRGLFWVTAKSRVRFYRRPALLERVTVQTWPEPPGRLRSQRDFRLTAGEELLAEGKMEFVLVSMEDGRMHPPIEGFPAEPFAFPQERTCPGPFHRFGEAGAWTPFFRYTVGSTDIDLGGHMNNVAYVRMLERAFSTEEQKRCAPVELELHYRASSYEGEVLELSRRNTEAGLELRASKAEGGDLVLLALLRQEEP